MEELCFFSSTQTLSNRLCSPLSLFFQPVPVWKWVSIFLFSVVIGWLGAQAIVPNTVLTAGLTQGRRGGKCKVLRDPGPSIPPPPPTAACEFSVLLCDAFCAACSFMHSYKRTNKHSKKVSKAYRDHCCLNSSYVKKKQLFLVVVEQKNTGVVTCFRGLK